MSTQKQEDMLLSHHEQQELCTTRLPYRQGRKLTAVKVYTINNESKHLLIFGVPSLNLRRETKELFMKFGKLIQFNLTKHPSEDFTETYHALYESIQSSRLAKRMLDMKNYYGSNLHICYAPELESIEEVKEKLTLRKTHVLGRLKNLQREAELLKNDAKIEINDKIATETLEQNSKKKIIEINNEITETANWTLNSDNRMYMGEVNTITFGKRKIKESRTNSKKVKHIRKEINFEIDNTSFNPNKTVRSNQKSDLDSGRNDMPVSSKTIVDDKIEVIDCTSVKTDVISNIDEALNYKNFGQEIIRKVPNKPLNKIKFNINKNV